MWVAIPAGIVVGIVLFFVLPFLEKPRQKFLGWFGVKSKKEEPKTVIQEEPKLVAKREEPKPAILIPEPTFFLSPDPFEIIKTIKALPLLLQEEAAKHYAGIRVDWKGSLSSMERTGAGMLRVMVLISRGYERPAIFFFEINSSDYPGIGTLNDGDPVHAEGYIKKIEGNLFSLRDSKLISYGKQPPK